MPNIDYTAITNSPNCLRRFGNYTATSTSEALVSARPYVEPASQAQRSIVSTSAVDSDALGTGAGQIRITFLTSAYELKTEDVFTNGTTGVDTVATDIRFVESLEVIKGTDAVGALKLMTGLAGAGTEIAGIGVATSQSFMAHHYVPAGKQAYVIHWGATSDDEVALKLLGQDRFGANLVPRVLDLEKVFGGNPTPPQHLEFDRSLAGVVVPARTYIRMTAVPNQATSTVIRGWVYVWEESL
jgi:hypothetical protein